MVRHRPVSRRRTAILSVAILGLSVSAARLAAQPAAAEATRVFTIAEGAFTLEAPEGWKQVPPTRAMVETEFTIAPGAGDEAGRMTVMGAGGSVQLNIDRWFGQFTQPDGSDTKDRASTKKLRVAGCDVTMVDIAGTYKDMPGGPFAGGKAVERPGYRMLAAIVETSGRGNYFLKFYGPADLVAAHADGFRKMVEGLVAAGK